MAELSDQLRDALRDRYVIERELGQGGMATVYLARDLKHDRLVALKVLRPELATTLGPDRFVREIRVTASLDHPHILPVFDSGEAVGLLWYTMPYVEGESLRDRLRREGQLPVEAAVQIAREVADSLDCAHQHGVIHRDIKPENILLARGHARVADFGIARALEAAGGGSITETGLAIGTPAYMSPEQASGSPVDARTDVYALGCVLYEMLAGEPPFSGPTPQAIVAKRFADPVPSVRRLREGAPDTLDRVVKKALAKSAADRFQTASELAQALARGAAENFEVPSPWRAFGPVAVPLAALFFVLGAVVLWQRSHAGASQNDAARTAGGEQSSVAVLPFENVGADSAQLYFADGITDELATALAKVPGLQVAARTSSYAFRGRTADVREVGRQLGVMSVLTGSVRRAGRQLRVTAQLADTRTGLVRWTDAYSADSGDVFAVQTRLVRAILGALSPTFAAGGRAGESSANVASVVDSSRGTDDLVAYDLYLRARYLYWQRGSQEMVQAESLLALAIRRDPAFARAYSALAVVYANLTVRTSGTSRDTVVTALQRATEQALALDDGLAEAHAARAFGLYYIRGRWAEAEAEYHRALALDPRSTLTHVWYGNQLVGAGGSIAEGVAQLRTAAALDPFSAFVTASYASMLALAGRRDEALTAAARALALDSTTYAVRLMVGQTYWRLGDYRRALPHFEAADRLGFVDSKGDPGWIAGTYARIGERGRALAIVARLERQPGADTLPPYGLVWAYIGLGDVTRALNVLERLNRRGQATWIMQFIATEPVPYWEPLVRDPRYARLREQVLGGP